MRHQPRLANRKNLFPLLILIASLVPLRSQGEVNVSIDGSLTRIDASTVRLAINEVALGGSFPIPPSLPPGFACPAIGFVELAGAFGVPTNVVGGDISTANDGFVTWGYATSRCMPNQHTGGFDFDVAADRPARLFLRNSINVEWWYHYVDDGGHDNWQILGGETFAAVLTVDIPLNENEMTSIRVADLTIPSLSEPAVRVAYLVPSNRMGQGNAVPNLQGYVERMRTYYRQEMERNGFGSRTIRYETEADGVTPKVYVMPVSETDDYLRAAVWQRVVAAASGAGVPLWSQGEVWLLVAEIHLEQPDGTVIPKEAYGAGGGSGLDPGVAVLTSQLVAFDPDTALFDTRNYAGLVVPAIGPYPLVPDLSFWLFEGPTFSSVVSSFLGAMVHEVAHGFGLSHDFRNDDNFKGNLMGNGLRGIRGALYSDFFRNDDTQLTVAAALALSNSAYFHSVSVPLDLADEAPTPSSHGLDPGSWKPWRIRRACLKDFSDWRAWNQDIRPPPPNPVIGWKAVPCVAIDAPPSLTILTSGAVSPVAGSLRIHFQASDDLGLASALLLRLQQYWIVLGEMEVLGTSVSGMFETPYYTPGQNDQSGSRCTTRMGIALLPK